MKYHCTPTRTAKIKNSDNKKLGALHAAGKHVKWYSPSRKAWQSLIKTIRAAIKEPRNSTPLRELTSEK